MKTCAKQPPKLAALRIVVSFEQLVGLFVHVAGGCNSVGPWAGLLECSCKLEQTLLQAAAQSLLCYDKSGYKMPFEWFSVPDSLSKTGAPCNVTKGM